MQPSSPGDLRQKPQVLIAARYMQTQGHLLYTTPSSCCIRDHRLFASGWSPVLSTHTWRWYESLEIHALYNRFPASRDPLALERLTQACLQLGLPIANHPLFQRLVQDKWQTTQYLQQAGVRIPHTVLAFHEMAQALQTWRYAFLKPRYGAFGEQIYVISAQHSSIHLEGPRVGQFISMPWEQWLPWLQQHFTPGSVVLQQGVVLPVSSWRGFSVRSLLQRTSDGSWHTHPRVARVSSVDPVANVARGAHATSLLTCLRGFCGDSEIQKLYNDLHVLEQQTAQVLLQNLPELGPLPVVEMGIDLILDSEKKWWVLEVNGFPQGRLQSLVAQEPTLQGAYELAHCLPLRTLMHAVSASSL